MVEVLLKYGIGGVFILVLLVGIKQIYTDNRGAIKALQDQHEKERKENQENFLNEFKRLFDEMKEDKHEIKEIAKSYSKELREVTKVLEGIRNLLESREKK